MARFRSRSGFTLIEISLVLVIIAIVVGGVLFGRDLVHVAVVRAQISQIEQMDVAVNAFRFKYNCLPGDCASATSFGFNDNGNGDGAVGYHATHLNLAIELATFWTHLGDSGLIGGTYSLGSTPGLNSPPLLLSGASGGLDDVENGRGGFWVGPTSFVAPQFSMRHAWLLIGSTSFDKFLAIYLPRDVQMMDAKIDDALPASGIFQVSGGAYLDSGSLPAAPGTSGDGSDACVDDLAIPRQYNVQSNVASWTSLCAPVIRTEW